MAVGGRNTRGGVYRISYDAEASTPSVGSLSSDDPLAAVLRAPQPLASWSRARWRPLAALAGRSAIQAAALSPHRAPNERRRAVEILVECFAGPTLDELAQLAADETAAVRTAAAWAAGFHADPAEVQPILSRLTNDEDLTVLRAAWEALARTSHISIGVTPQPAWGRAESSPSRRIRTAMMVVARTDGAASYTLFTALHPSVGVRADLTRLEVESASLTDDARARIATSALAA